MHICEGASYLVPSPWLIVVIGFLFYLRLFDMLPSAQILTWFLHLCWHATTVQPTMDKTKPLSSTKAQKQLKKAYKLQKCLLQMMHHSALAGGLKVLMIPKQIAFPCHPAMAPLPNPIIK